MNQKKFKKNVKIDIKIIKNSRLKLINLKKSKK